MANKAKAFAADREPGEKIPLQNSRLGQLSVAEALRQLGAKEKIQSLYLFFGDEPYIKDELVRTLCRSLALEAETGFDFDRFEDDAVDISAVIACAQTPPWLQERRLVMVRNCTWFQGSKKGKTLKDSGKPAGKSPEKSAAKPEEEKILDYFQAPNPQTVLLLLASGDLDRRRKLFRKLLDCGVVVECPEQKERERRAWLYKQTRELGMNFSPGSLDYLVNFGGKALYGLAHELEKIKTYLGSEPKQVTLELVQTLCPLNFEERIFDVTNAVSEGNYALAIQRIRELSAAGFQAPRIFYLLVRHYRILLRARALLPQGLSESEYAKQLQLNYRIVPKYLREAQRFSSGDLELGLQKMLEIDLALKTSQGTPEQWLEVFIAAHSR